MSELIAQIFLVSGILGIVIIMFRKLPLLASLPEAQKDSSLIKEDSGSIIKRWLAGIPIFKSFSIDAYFQKILLKIRILTLKLENKISSQLQALRTKSQEKQNSNDNYWEDLKKSTIQKVIRKRKPKQKEVPAEPVTKEKSIND